jgi:hypothetical protein
VDARSALEPRRLYRQLRSSATTAQSFPFEGFDPRTQAGLPQRVRTTIRISRRARCRTFQTALLSSSTELSASSTETAPCLPWAAGQPAAQPITATDSYQRRRPCDLTAPTAPVGLTATAVSPTYDSTCRGQRETDNVGITSYKVFRDNSRRRWPRTLDDVLGHLARAIYGP